MKESICHPLGLVQHIFFEEPTAVSIQKSLKNKKLFKLNFNSQGTKQKNSPKQIAHVTYMSNVFSTEHLAHCNSEMR